MEYINRIEIQGRVGTVRINEVNGNKVANFSVATEYLYKSREAGPVSETTWHYVVAWGGRDMADIDRITKGVAVSVCGRLRMTKYTAADGNEKQVYEIMASRLKVLAEEDTEKAVQA